MAHPLLACATNVRAQLAEVADVNPVYLPVEEKAELLVQISAAKAQLAELELRTLAVAGDVGDQHAARCAADWLAAETRQEARRVRGEGRLAEAIDRDWHRLGAGLREGRVNLDQAQVINRALGKVKDQLDEGQLVQAEEFLVREAKKLTPRELGNLGRHLLEVVAPDHADAVEAKRLADEERHADQKTSLSFTPQGDGTTRIAGRLPDATASRLRTYLEAFTSPRSDPQTQLPYPRRLGVAFGALLEHLDPGNLPAHGGDATTLVVTIDEAYLRDQTSAGQLLDGTGLSIDQARRLACTAGILPMVLNGEGLPLDVGRTQRLFTSAQRKAMAIRDKHCRTVGCRKPPTWCESHHLKPWSDGGNTDLADGILLCSCTTTGSMTPTTRSNTCPTVI